MTKIGNVERQLSELKSERQHSCNISVQEERAPALSVKVKEANATNACIRHNQLEADKKTDFSTNSADTNAVRICISQWVQEAITLEEAVRCMNG
jgi:hypothetical protein